VAVAAMETGVAQRIVNVEDIKQRLLALAEAKQPVLV
jgi:malate dehydrogenase (oxaloacetate-decarboxylating)